MAGESKIERKVRLDAQNKLGVPSVKWGIDGWPDRIFFIPFGKPLIIEFKDDGKEPNPRQQFRIACLKTWGYNVEVHDNYDSAFQAISNSLDAARLLQKSSKIHS